MRVATKWQLDGLVHGPGEASAVWHQMIVERMYDAGVEDYSSALMYLTGHGYEVMPWRGNDLPTSIYVKIRAYQFDKMIMVWPAIKTRIRLAKRTK